MWGETMDPRPMEVYYVDTRGLRSDLLTLESREEDE